MTDIINTFDIKTVDKSVLVDADDICVDIDAPKMERMTSTIKQMKGNPYFFKCKSQKGDGYLAVEVAYADTDLRLDDCAESWMRAM